MKLFKILTPLPLLALAAWVATTPLNLNADDRVIVVSSAGDLSEGLDLNALGEVFQSSTDLQHFEQQINNPELYLNNLDINGDGKVDFLRVLEEETDYGRLITIQAIVGENTFTDVAYIDIQRDNSGKYQVQIRGEEALYGERTYYVPRYDYVTWPIVLSLWGPDYYYYNSPYYWGHYPTWYSPYSCVRLGYYRARVAYRYPRNNFYFSFNACFDNYRRSHHSHHKYYRDYNWHRKDRRHDDRYRRDGHRDYRKGYSSRNPGFDNHNRKYAPTRQPNGENRNVSDERIRRLHEMRNHRDAEHRSGIRQERMDRNSRGSSRITPYTTNNDRSRSSYRTRDRDNRSDKPAITSKPTTRTRTEVRSYSPPRPTTTTSKPTPTSKINTRSYSAPKPSKPSSYTAPKPSSPSRNYSAPRSQPRPSREYSPRSSNRRYESPRQSHSRSRDNAPSRPRR